MAIISLPIFILMIRDNWKISKISTYALISGSVFVLGFVPFANNENLISFIFSRVTMSLNQYPYTSVNAFNLWAITGSWRSDTGLNIIGGAVAIIAFFAMAKKFQKKGEEYTLLAISYAASFLFMTRMHERHLLPIFAPLTISLASNPSFIFALIGFSFIYLANLYWAWNWITYTFKDVFGDFLVKTLSAVNILLLSFFVLPKKVSNIQSKTTQIIRKYQKLTQISKFEEFKKTPISSGIINLLFIAVILFASGTRFYNLNNPPKHYFDEVYHAFTAQEMLHGVTYAWEWWNPNPKDYAYEWTHPPLAKELMALSMKFLGETAFAWRFPGALLGTLSVIMIFFIAKEIFKDDLLALLSSAIFALDGLPLTLSRIGMNDSYVLFFSLACVYSYLKNKNLLASIFLGLSLASKWSGLWLVPIIFVIHFATKKKLKLSYFYFFLLPPLIYLSSYFPLFTNKQIQNEYVVNNYYEARTDKTGIIPLDMFIDTQKQMWWYHTRLKATHSYTSMWYTWPFSVRPVYLYTSEETKMEVSRIYAMGNPAIFWGGVLAISVSIFLAIKEKNKRLGIVVFSYLVFFVPWALSPRIMFLYHYLPSIPFMAIATAYILRRFDEWISPFLILSFATFLYFYPHFSGTKIPIWLDSSYYWFKSWR
jgi:predicted membrane-bound dolichyl-phosphate-mannose-protein mannosyltransferase